MKLQGSVIKEQGVTFAIVIVKKYVLDSQIESKKAINSFSGLFPNMPIVLMAQDHKGLASYRGRKDIVKFLTNLNLTQIPWKEYTIN